MPAPLHAEHLVDVGQERPGVSRLVMSRSAAPARASCLKSSRMPTGNKSMKISLKSRIARHSAGRPERRGRILRFRTARSATLAGAGDYCSPRTGAAGEQGRRRHRLRADQTAELPRDNFPTRASTSSSLTGSPPARIVSIARATRIISSNGDHPKYRNLGLVQADHAGPHQEAGSRPPTASWLTINDRCSGSILAWICPNPDRRDPYRAPMARGARGGIGGPCT